MITGAAGTGLTLVRQGNMVVIGDVAPDSPGAEAGIAAGTQVLAIDGRPVYPGALPVLNANLAGIPGSTTTLRLRDPDGVNPPNDVMLTRALVPEPTVMRETDRCARLSRRGAAAGRAGGGFAALRGQDRRRVRA
jgi:C-terminal processing protease CtpA/Prc